MAGRGAGTLRRDAQEIFRAALKSVSPGEALRKELRVKGERLFAGGKAYSLKKYRRVLLIGFGKASAAMAGAAEAILGERLSGGLIITKYGHELPLKRVEARSAGHPVPDEAGLRATREIISLLEEAGEEDLILCLISGGGSALLVGPAPGLSLEDKQRTTELLLRSGATIHELNALRKHLSSVKGGRLARVAAPATLLSFILSDVVGDRLDVIASGPTAPDKSTFGECLEILSRYGLEERVPPPVMSHLKAGARGEREETPRPGHPVFRRVKNLVIANNTKALNAAARRARALGYRPLVLTHCLEGESREVARVLSAMAQSVRERGRPTNPPACLLAGGETTVTLRGQGKGGRNQELSLAGALALEDVEGVLLL
ncbi:MAG: glycerate kinase, partial [Nitrospinota bacterium]